MNEVLPATAAAVEAVPNPALTSGGIASTPTVTAAANREPAK